MQSEATNFREYPRGRDPDDWTQIWAPSTYRVRSVEADAMRKSWIAPSLIGGALAALTWNAPIGDSGHADQEVRILLRLSEFELDVAFLRASGAASAETAYAFSVDPFADQVHIYSIIAGTRLLLSSAAAILTSEVPVWVRLSAVGTTISMKAWQEGVAEPVGWTLTLGSAAIADGEMGISGAAGLEYRFFGYATAGATAPGPSAIPPGMATWSLDPGAAVEITFEAEALNPDSEELHQIFLSTRGRFTTRGDYPSAGEMPPLLTDPGTLSLRLAEDLLFGAAQSNLGQATLRNPRNLLSYFLDLTFAGRRVIVRAGLAGWKRHRWFEPLFTALSDGEPTVGPQAASGGSPDSSSAEQVLFSFQDPNTLLEPMLTVRKYIGIPTAAQIYTGTPAAPHLAAYDLQRFLISFRFRFSAPPAVDTGISKSTALGANNFTLVIEAGTGRAVGHASIGGLAYAIRLQGIGSLCNGVIRQVALAVDTTQAAFLMIDGEVADRITPPGVVDLPGADLQIIGFAGQQIFDIRLLGYCPEESEAQTMLAVRAAGDDPAMVGLWPLDDGLGNLGTDYALSNPISFPGTINVDFAWVPTDMGEEKQSGTPMQIAQGAVFNAPALLIDTNRSRFRLNDGPLPGLIVRSKGAVIGTWTDQGDGVIQFPTVVSEPVTFDVVPGALGAGASSLWLSQVELALLQQRMAMTEADYDPLSPGLALNPLNAAYFTDTEASRADALTSLVSGSAGHIRFDRDGRLVIDAVLPPISPGPIPGQAVLELLGTSGRSRATFSGAARGALPAASGFTVAFWCKSFATDRYTVTGDALNPFPSSQAIATNLSDLTFGGYYIGFHRAIQGAIGFKFPATSFVSPAGAVSWGIWTMGVGRYDPVAGKFSIWTGKLNGVAVKVYETAVGFNPATAFAVGPLSLGGSLKDAASLIGSVAHFQVYSSALTDNGIQSLMSTIAPTDPSLTFYAPLNEGAGDVVHDIVSGAKGYIWGGRWAPKLIFDFRQGLSRSSLAIKRLRPAWDAIVTWGKNQHPLAEADLAGTVSALDRSLLKQTARRAHSPAGRVRSDFLGARDIPLDSPLMVQADARQVARNVRYRFDPSRAQAAILDAPRPSIGLINGDEVWIFHPRIRGTGGAAVRCVGLSPTYATLRSTLDLWGSRITAPETAIMTNSYRKLITEAGEVIVAD